MAQIKLAEFSRFPFGRTARQGPFNGARFRDERLVPAFKAASEPVEVDLDGARGLSPSFLEEAFGGLLRVGLSPADVKQRLRLKSDRDPSVVALIQSYIEDQAARQR